MSRSDPLVKKFVGKGAVNFEDMKYLAGSNEHRYLSSQATEFRQAM